MLIRQATPADHRATFDVHSAAFATDDGSLVFEAALVEALYAAGDVVGGLSLVAEVDHQVVGHVLGSRADLGGRVSVGLGPLGVGPAHQGLGVGSALMHAALAAADALGLPEVVLRGDPGYYQRFGCVAAVPIGVVPPDPLWGEHFQVRTLSAWAPSRTGSFRYAPAFGLG